MSSHRASQDISVVPKDFSWNRVVPDLSTIISALVGLTFGFMIVLILLLAEFPNLVGAVLLSVIAWCAASVGYIWLKGHGRH